MRMTIVHLLIAEHIRIALCAFVGVSICQTEHCFLAYCNSEIASHACLFNLMLFRGPLVSLSSFLFFFFPRTISTTSFPSFIIYHICYYFAHIVNKLVKGRAVPRTVSPRIVSCHLKKEKKKSSKWSNTILSI